LPARVLSGAAAAAGIALINTVGNLAGFVAPYITGVVKDATGSYQASMLVVGALMLVSACLALVAGSNARRLEDNDTASVGLASHVSPK
jgi:nitrate/nitrite transporter NarK